MPNQPTATLRKALLEDVLYIATALQNKPEQFNQAFATDTTLAREFKQLVDALFSLVESITEQ